MIVHRKNQQVTSPSENDTVYDNNRYRFCVGWGWLTITLQTMYTYGELDGNSCKLFGFYGCNPYVKLFVNGAEKLRTPTAQHKYVFNADVTFTTSKIPKNSTIMIQIWDASAAFWEKDALILNTEGDIDSFLNEPLREGVIIKDNRNAIETVPFWQDEYE